MSLLTLQGLRADRLPVLPGGLAIMLAVFREFNLERMTFSEGALRLGVLYDLLGRYHHQDLRNATVQQFMRRYQVDANLSSVSAVEIPRDTGDFRLIDRKVVDALRRLPEKKRFLRGLVPWLGFKQVGIAVDRGAREIGESTYTIRRLLRLAFDGILAFSVAPLFLIPVVGGILGALGLIALAAAFAVAPATQPFVFVMSGLLILSGVQVLSTGLVAIYLSTALEELRGRPTYLIGEKLGKGFEGNVATPSLQENRESRATKEDALDEALSAAASSR